MSKLSRLPSRLGWLIILIATLTVSGWSLYWIARHWGVPPLIAVCLSACFDGVALLAADYSLQAVRDAISDRWPRTIVLAFAAASAYVNSLHAQLAHEIVAARLAWAVPPLAATVAFDLHNRRERAKARARVGAVYPAPLPSFGLETWILFPFHTLTQIREVIANRALALTKAAAQTALANKPNRASNATNKPSNVALTANANAANSANSTPAANLANAAPNPVSEPANASSNPEANADSNQANPSNVVSMDRPHLKDVRAWAKREGYKIGDRARIPAQVWEDYRTANGG